MSWGCLNSSSSFRGFASLPGDRRLWRSSWTSSRPHDPLPLECADTHKCFILSLLCCFIFTETLWLKLGGGYHRPWSQSLLFCHSGIIPAPLSHHVIPHPLVFPAHSRYRISHFILIWGHWQVNHVTARKRQRQSVQTYMLPVAELLSVGREPLERSICANLRAR